MWLWCLRPRPVSKQTAARYEPVSEWRLVGTSSPSTERVVCPHLWQSPSRETRRIKYMWWYELTLGLTGKCPQRSWAMIIKCRMYKGCVMSPTQRSLNAKLRKRSFDGGWRDVSFFEGDQYNNVSQQDENPDGEVQRWNGEGCVKPCTITDIILNAMAKGLCHKVKTGRIFFR